MANFFKDWLFNQLPRYHQKNDTFKDIVGDGLLKRYLRAFGMELDEGFLPFLDNFLDLVDVIKVQTKHLPLLGSVLGYPPSANGADDIYRKILAYAVAIYKVKGTLKSFQILFNLLGLEMDIIELMPHRKVIYDAGFMYDDDNIYDSECDNCSGYYIKYNLASDPCNGPYGTVTSDTIATINKIICLVNPINAVFLGLIRRFKVCDDLPLNLIDNETNFCSIVTGIYGTYNTDTNEATFHWDDPDDQDFELRYRELGDTVWSTIIPVHNGDIIPDLEDNKIYEFQFRRICGDNDHSDWVTALLFTEDGILNESEHSLIIEVFEYIRNSPAINILTDYRFGWDTTDPIHILSILINGEYIPGDFDANNIDEVVDWLNTLGKGSWTKVGTSIISTGNPNVVSQLFFIIPGDDTGDKAILIDAYGRRPSDGSDILKADYKLTWALTGVDPITVTGYRIDGEDVTLGSPIVIDDGGWLAGWLNSLDKGAFTNSGNDIISTNSHTISWITYNDIDGNPSIAAFSQRNLRIGIVTNKLVLADYAISLNPVDEPILIVNFKLRHQGSNESIDGPLSEFNSAEEIIDWLNLQNRGVYSEGPNGEIQSLQNPDALMSITYHLVSDLGTDMTIEWTQRNHRIQNFAGILTTITLNTTLANNDILPQAMDPGLYDKISLRFATGQTLPAGGKILTSGYPPYIGFMDDRELIFVNVTLGSTFQLIIL